VSSRLAALTGWIALLALLLAAPVLAQGTGGATSLSGVVVDTQGGFIPGATIEIRNTATGVTETVVSNANGAFAVPALSPGLYTVTVSLNGFKTYVLSEVRLIAATRRRSKQCWNWAR
jgi:carboxypeptidase family protein